MKSVCITLINVVKGGRISIKNFDEICQKFPISSGFLTLKRGPSSLKMGLRSSFYDRKIFGIQ